MLDTFDLMIEMASWLVKNSCSPFPPIDSIMRLMTVWRITGKIVRTAIIITYAQL